MKAKELRQFSTGDLEGRVKQWKEELFRTRFKTEASEARDTSVIRKLRRDIARAKTLLVQKRLTGDSVPVTAQPAQAPVPGPKDKPAKKKAKAGKTA